jgi:hypothetical protein
LKRDVRVILVIAVGLSLGGCGASGAVSPPAGDRTERSQPVAELARQLGFGRMAGRIAAAARPTITIARRLAVGTMLEPGASRLGGSPDLPLAARWPRCHGRPMAFVGQIRSQDLPATGSELHGAGLLLFFADVVEDGDGSGSWTRAGDCVVVIRAPAGALVRRVSAPHENPRLVLRQATVTFAIRPSLPDRTDDRGRLAAPLSDVRLETPERQVSWSALRLSLIGAARPAHRLLGYVTNPGRGGGSCGIAHTRRLLAEFGWDAGIGFTVGEGGRLQFLMAPGDLRRGRFDRVCGRFEGG